MSVNHHPRQEFNVTLSMDATKYIVSYLTKNSQYVGVRLSVKKTGCSGLSYVIDYVGAPVAEDLVLPLDNAYNLYVDKTSTQYLHGVNIDYVQQGLNRKFVFINPNQKGQCGCGESFTV